MSRRLLLLGGSAAAAAVAFALQVARLRLDPDGAAVHGVAVLVTLIVFVILLRLVRLQLGGPGLDAPSWERHEHRASVREAPLVALAGMGVAAFMAIATPRLVAEERTIAPPKLEVHITERKHVPAVAPAPEARREVRLEYAWQPPRPQAKAFEIEESETVPISEPVVNYRWMERSQEEDFQETPQEPEDPTRPGRDMLRVEPAKPGLPPIHFSVGAFLAMGRGSLDLASDAGTFELQLDNVTGEQTFNMGVDLTAEFSLTPESALKLMYAGVGFFERGHLSGDTSFGGSAGDRFEFEMRWSHLYMALAKRLTDHRERNSLDISVHAGAMVDHTLSEFESGGVSAESEDGERGWASLAAGFSLSFQDAGPAGFILEFVQSVPVNLGGQAIAVSDIRAAVTLDLTDQISLFGGYRYVRAVYRLFEAPIVREGGRTAADLLVRGPTFGIDFRF
jgi:hypothetical protein